MIQAAGTSWVEVVRMRGPGSVNISVFAKLIRANVLFADGSSTPSLNISAQEIAGTLQAGSVSLTALQGMVSSSGFDVSMMNFAKTFYLSSGSDEVVNVEVSNDNGTSWTRMVQLNSRNMWQHINAHAQRMRINTSSR